MYSTSLTEICSWQGCQGWQGVKCHHCGATHNVLVNIPGIRCERCKEFIVLSWSYYQFCHKHPDYGFKASVIGWAMKNFSYHKEYFKECSVMLKKLNKRLVA